MNLDMGSESMKDIENLKFITEDDNEYVVLFNKVIDENTYGYAVNLNDESDAICVRIAEDEEGYLFDIVEDPEIIKEILNLKRS
jgi:hypothetical protein